jgi:hypothetical protein
MTGIDAKEAAAALSDIDSIVQRVRQSQIYNLASLIAIMWGVLVFAGNVATFVWPRYGGYVWILVNAAGVAGTIAISVFSHPRIGERSFDIRVLAAFLLFFAFGYFCTSVLGHFSPRQLATFWPIYFMLLYTVAGLWFGYAFVAIGLGISVLTMIGYFFVADWFEPWMAVVNGGGLVLGGLWMRRS